jgi:L-threonylcarbamoyladenylate synthase
MALIGKDINKAKELLEHGELVAIPTETVYGLAANALNVDAVLQVFEVKSRPQFDPLIVHVANPDQAEKYAAEISLLAKKLMSKFWPGPLTIVLPKKKIIPDLVTSGMDTVGLRCPDHPLTHALLSELDFPLAAPSANPFGYVSPTTSQHVEDQLGNKINYILDGGPSLVGIESTIVGFENSNPVIYRMGGIAVEEIEKEIGLVSVQTQSTSNPKAPGQLISHYAPLKKVIIGKMRDLLQKYPAHSSAILSFKEDFNSPFQRILSPTGSVNEAAKNLFSHLRELDKMPVDLLLVELIPDEGLGRAVNDRLRRAAGNS